MKAAERLVRGDLREPVSLYWKSVSERPEFRDADTVLAYMSIDGEVPTHPVLPAWAGRKRIAIPLVCGDRLELREYSPSGLVRGYKGIWEPSEASSVVHPENVDLALVPGVAFCRKGGKVFRMGRGGGFYDRLLPGMDCFKLGVCFEYRVLDDIPADPWDALLDDLAVCRI